MAEETPAPNKMTAVLESFGTRGLGRMQIIFSVPLTEIGTLLPFLARQLKNPVDLTFAAVQPGLFDDEDEAGHPDEDYEMVDMIVDGETHQVRRLKNRNGNGHLHVDEPYGNLETAADEQLSEQASKLLETIPADDSNAATPEQVEARERRASSARASGS